jgi:hypothetical protein
MFLTHAPIGFIFSVASRKRRKIKSSDKLQVQRSWEEMSRHEFGRTLSWPVCRQHLLRLSGDLPLYTLTNSPWKALCYLLSSQCFSLCLTNDCVTKHKLTTTQHSDHCRPYMHVSTTQGRRFARSASPCFYKSHHSMQTRVCYRCICSAPSVR